MSIPLEVQLDDLDVNEGVRLRAGGSSQKVTVVSYHQEGSLVAKVYRPKMLIDVEALVNLVAWRHTLPPSTRNRLDTIAAFPLAVVKDGTQVVGVLMRLAPAEFMHDVGEGPSPVNADLISWPPVDALEMALPYIEVPRKLAYVGSLLAVLGELHQLGVVFADVQPGNVLVDLSSPVTTGVFLLDCDSVILNGRHAVELLEPPMWERPEGVGLDERSDAYKAMLLALRALNNFAAVAPFTLEDLTDFMSTEHAQRVVDVLQKPSSFHVRSAIRLGGIWNGNVHEDGSMFVSSDQSELEAWTPLVQVGPAEPRTAPSQPPTWLPVEPVSAPPAPDPVFRARRRWPVRAAVAAVAAVIVVGVLVVTGKVDLTSATATFFGGQRSVPTSAGPATPAPTTPPKSNFVAATATPVGANVSGTVLHWVGSTLVLTTHVTRITNTTTAAQVYSYDCARRTPAGATHVPPGPFVWVDQPPPKAVATVFSPGFWYHTEPNSKTPTDAYMPAACAVATNAGKHALATKWRPVTVAAGKSAAIPANANTLEFVLPSAGMKVGRVPKTGYAGVIYGLYFGSDDSTTVASASVATTVPAVRQ